MACCEVFRHLTPHQDSRLDKGVPMKLTPFGFVSRSEVFVKDALSLPPVGGGKWVTRRTANFLDHSGSLRVSIIPEAGSEKTAVILHSRLTGGSRDGGIQGWIERPGSELHESFILKEADADRAMEEIFDIVEKTLAHVPEWDQSALPPRPEPAPRVFEPLIPAIQATEPEAETPAESPAVDMQAFVDSMLSPDSFEEPPTVPAEPAPTEAMEPPADHEVTAEAAAMEQPPVEEDSKSAKKTSKGKKTKA